VSWRRWAIGGATALLLVPGPVHANEWELGLLAGFRFDGELRDPADFSRVPLDGASAIGVFGRARFQGVAAEVAWSRSSTTLDASRTSSVRPGLELRTEHLQAGLQLELGEGSLRPFVGVAAGVSRFSPSSGAAEPEYTFSVGGVLGAYWSLLPRLRLRLEGRGFASRPDREGGSFCSDAPAGVCEVRNPDGFFLQSQVALGLSVVF
jgi:hypothetical protein